MRHGKARHEPDASEITAEHLYLRRREFLKNSALFAGTAAAVGGGLVTLMGGGAPSGRQADATPLVLPPGARPYPLNVAEPRTSFEDVTSYNNYYELGLGKSDPARLGHLVQTRPWTITVDGEVSQRRTLDLDDVLRWFPLEERVYRMRCVEAWSMVIPWVGFPLADLVKRLEPTSRARYVAFTTLLDPSMLPGQDREVLEWPYTEGLRIDEATHPLALLAVGLYGKALLGQNGAPLRLVVPWKYGFKGIKAIVGVRFTEERPRTTWNIAAPREYGFYANVNPAVDHPRWSQATERRIGEISRRATLPFNGYAEQVASMYDGLDLRDNF